MVSCETETTKPQKIQDNVEETIGKKKIKVLYHYCDIWVYEIDGHLYANYGRGGLTHLESCKCKNYRRFSVYDTSSGQSLPHSLPNAL